MEAEVVAVNKSYAKELGIDWDFKSLTGSASYDRDSWTEQHYVLDENGDIKTDKNGEDHIFSKREFKMVGRDGNNYTFEATFEPDVAGAFKSCVRMYPKNENLVHREDFCYVKWLD